MSYHCEICNNQDNAVIDSRRAALRINAGHREWAVRRRRQCRVCGYRWTTYEMTAGQVQLFLDAVKADVAVRMHQWTTRTSSDLVRQE
jgi:transcriptional regulator NrdR family protein